MKKIILMLFCLSCFLPVFAARAQQTQQVSSLTKALEKAAAESQQNKEIRALVEEVAVRLRKELNIQQATAQQVVAWLYEIETACFEEQAKNEFRWRTTVPGAMYIDPNITEEEFVHYQHYVVDYSFAQVFPQELTAQLFDYGDGACSFDKAQYAPVKDKKMLKEDLDLQMGNLRRNLMWLALAKPSDFKSFWSWLLEE